jgi:hypothetical protein
MLLSLMFLMTIRSNIRFVISNSIVFAWLLQSYKLLSYLGWSFDTLFPALDIGSGFGHQFVWKMQQYYWFISIYVMCYALCHVISLLDAYFYPFYSMDSNIYLFIHDVWAWLISVLNWVASCLMKLSFGSFSVTLLISFKWITTVNGTTWVGK